MTSIPFALTAALLALTVLPRLQANPVLTRSFWGAAAVLVLWNSWLILRFSGKPRRPRIVGVPPRPQHYIQTFCHCCVYAYWGYYWPPVYDFFPLLAGQLVFAYAFDILLAWSRGDDYPLGWGPFPIVFSTNLFLWFKDDVFYWQFLLVALGFAGKAFVRWNREMTGTPGAAPASGLKRVHIFNPSAFTLAVFSVVLLATGTTSLTWGQEIATTFSLGPRIYTVLFLIGLVVMYFFAITTVTAAAAITLVGLSVAYYGMTGVPYFVDSDIPSAVFLGMHLLVTDPSTSPRTPFGRVIFGVSYGLGVFGLYSLLGSMGMPTFYDKLLCVPILNLLVPSIDRVVKSIGPSPLLRRLALDGPLGRGNLGHMAAWAGIFVVMMSTGSADGMHRGDALPFWVQACADGKPKACERLVRIEGSYCGDNAGWACNELGRHYREGRIVQADPGRAAGYFSRACEGRFQAGCLNIIDAATPWRASPRTFDLRLLLREGGPNLLEMPEPELLARACRHGWSFACHGASAFRRIVPVEPAAPAPLAVTPGTHGARGRVEAPGFVEIAAGPFTMGADRSRNPQAFDNERWPGSQAGGTIDLPAFYIAPREVTVAEFAEFATSTSTAVDPRAVSGPPTSPVAFVSWPDAMAYTRWLTAKLRLPDGWEATLPTEAQWEKAARGTDARVFPWGNDPRPDRANFGTTGTVPAGSHSCPECGHGLSDMAGNVWEWTRSPLQPYPYSDEDDGTNLDQDALWVIRGGGYADGLQMMRATTRGAAEPGARRPFIGFRVVIAPR